MKVGTMPASISCNRREEVRMSIIIHLQAIRDLLKRYGEHIRHAWEHRKEMDSPMCKRRTKIAAVAVAV
jgi:hypothetical protein